MALARDTTRTHRGSLLMESHLLESGVLVSNPQHSPRWEAQVHLALGATALPWAIQTLPAAPEHSIPDGARGLSAWAQRRTEGASPALRGTHRTHVTPALLFGEFCCHFQK